MPKVGFYIASLVIFTSCAFSRALPVDTEINSKTSVAKSSEFVLETITSISQNNNGTRECKKDNKFYCQSENKFIPIELRCDFTEHCLAGEDEYNCSPEFCKFEHHLCNWKNDFTVSPNQTKPGQLGQNSPLVAWRKYHNNYHEHLTTEKQINFKSNLSTNNIENSFGMKSVNNLLEQKLSLLRSSTNSSSKFIFIPLISSQDNKNSGNVIRSSLLRSPFISHTNSNCLLIIKYALWSQLVESTWKESFKTRLTLRLKLYQNPPAHQRVPLSGSSKAESKSDKARVVWSKSIESSSSWSSSRSTLGSNEIEWLVDVVELGHLTGIELGFDAKLTLIPISDKTKRGKGKGKENDDVEQDRNQVKLEEQDSLAPVDEMIAERYTFGLEEEGNRKQATHASIVALNWFKFQNCAWPQGKREESPYINLADQIQVQQERFGQFQEQTETLAGGRLEKTSSSSSTKSGQELSQIESNLDRGRHGKEDESKVNVDVQVDDDNGVRQLINCRTNEFHCSNELCLERHKLCNFVDDCMKDSQSSSGQWKSEDESEDLCKNVPGMEDFELSVEETRVSTTTPTATPTTTTATTATTTTTIKTPIWQRSTKGRKFWQLTSNWPKDKARVQNSRVLSSTLHFPRADHTLKSVKGHYLSFEVPQILTRRSTQANITSSGSSLENKNVFWAYLRSAWMRKLAEECHLKFFYNVKSDRLNIWPNLQNGQFFKIYLAIEHFTAKRDTKIDSNQNREREREETRKLDAIIHSHLKDYENQPTFNSSLIDYPGVDFWREVNHELAELAEGDQFYVRIAIIVELLADYTNFKTTINIDDLSTHFGCALVSGEDEDEDNKGTALFPVEHENNRFKLSDYTAAARNASSRLLDYYNFVRRKRSNSTEAVKLEAHKLIICVVVVLTTIASLILIIVFIVVPWVERVAISYHDQLTAGLSGLGTTPGHSFDNTASVCELTTTDSDWEQISRQWRRSGNVLTDNEVTVLNS